MTRPLPEIDVGCTSEADFLVWVNLWKKYKSLKIEKYAIIKNMSEFYNQIFTDIFKKKKKKQLKLQKVFLSQKANSIVKCPKALRQFWPKI